MPEIDPQIADLIRAQLDANRIAQSELNVKRRLEAAQLESISSNESLKQEVRQVIIEARKLLEYMQNTALTDDALHDWFEQLSHKVERLETGLMLVLMDKLDSEPVRVEASRLVKNISKEHRQKLIMQHRKNLEVLEEQAAAYGAGNVPLEIRNQIDAEKEALDGLA